MAFQFLQVGWHCKSTTWQLPVEWPLEIFDVAFPVITSLPNYMELIKETFNILFLDNSSLKPISASGKKLLILLFKRLKSTFSSWRWLKLFGAHWSSLFLDQAEESSCTDTTYIRSGEECEELCCIVWSVPWKGKLPCFVFSSFSFPSLWLPVATVGHALLSCSHVYVLYQASND